MKKKNLMARIIEEQLRMFPTLILVFEIVALFTLISISFNVLNYSFKSYFLNFVLAAIIFWRTMEYKNKK